MLEVSVKGLTYHRFLAKTVVPEDTLPLKNKFDYSFIVAYEHFTDPDYHCIDKNACVIDLSMGAEAAFANFNSTSRNEVRRSEKISELTFTTGYETFGFDTFFEFHKNCEHDRDWFPVPPDELKNSLLFSASFNGMLIAGMSCYTHENFIRVGRIFSNKRSKKSEVLTNLVYGCASKRIVYEICKYGAANGFSQLDLGGVDLNDPAKSGISQFKLSLGSKVIPVKLARWSNDHFKTNEHVIRDNGWDLT